MADDEMNEIITDLSAAANSAGFVIQGVAQGFLIMAVPLLSIGLVVGLGLVLLRLPMRLLESVGVE